MRIFNEIHLGNLRGDIFGGVTAAVIALPMALAFGVASGAGAEAGLYGAILVGLFAALFGGSPTLISEPTGPMTVVMTAVIANLVAANPENGMAMAFTVVMLAGVFQMLYYVGPITSYGAKGGTNDPCHSRDDVLQRLRDIVAKAGDSKEPIVCWGYDRAEYNGDLDRDMLDEISDTIPISVTNYAPHISYVNSAMLKLIGQDESTKVQGIGRYPDGRLNGWFVEQQAFRALIGPLRDIIFTRGDNETTN